jgi:hypothetical protein
MTPLGVPAEFPALPPGMELVEVPDASHTFGSRRGRAQTMKTLTDAVVNWFERQEP